MKVKEENGLPIFTSQVVLSGPGNSYNELMGYPVDQFTTDYWFPFYDHGYPSVALDNVRTWILVGNPSDSTDAHVHIYIGGVEQTGSPFTVSPGSRVTPRWIGTIGGPVHVSSDIPVFASEREFTVPDNSFSEMMGYPADQLTTEYWFPWYELDQHGHQHQGGEHGLGPDGDGGYLHWCDARGAVRDPGQRDDFGILRQHAGRAGAGGEDQRRRHRDQPVDALWEQQQLQRRSWATPLDQFTTEYWFPYYDHGYPIVGGDNMRTWVLVGNPSGSTDAHVHIYIDGVEQSGSPFTDHCRGAG